MEGMTGDRLASVRRRLERWRRKHGGRGLRIPEELWSAAAQVARDEGVEVTARALQVDCHRLRGRATGAETMRATAAFVELPVGAMGAPGTTIELVGRGGERMRIHLGDGRLADLLGLAEAFWSRRS